MRVKLKTKKYTCSASQSLIEILIGIGIVGVVFSAVAGIVYVSLQGATTSKERSLAQSLANDMYTSVQSVSSYDWHALWSSISGVAYWPFDEGAGAAASNLTGIDEISGYNAVMSLGSSGNTSIANAWLSGTSCKSGSCLSFDGTDDVATVSVSATSTLDFTTAFSFSAWVYPTASSGAMMAKIPALANSGYEFLLSSNVLRTIIHGTSTCDYASGTLTPNAWQHIVVTYDGTYIRHYINGISVATSSCAYAPVANTNNLLIGGRASDTLKFAGRMDDARLYAITLSSAQIQALATGINAMHPSNTSGIRSIQEGTEQVTSGGIVFTRSFSLSGVQRDASNSIVSSGGTNDPLTKKLTLTVSWKSRTLTEQTYITRTVNPGSFVQANWSGGPGQTGAVFTAPSTFDSASSTVIYTTANQLTTQPSGSGGSIDSVYRYAWNDIAGWFDFYAVAYSSGAGTFAGFASSSMGSMSMTCIDTSCASSNYTVYQATSTGAVYTQGDVYGYGWSDAYGWVSFNCDQRGVGGSNSCATSNYKVSISTSTGDFAGWAWNDVLGWMSFNCDQTRFGGTDSCATVSYKVKLVQTTGFLDGILTSAIFDTQRQQGVAPVSMIWQGTLGAGTVKFKIASSRAVTGPWNFVGADGTTVSWYPLSGSASPDTTIPINASNHYNARYLRYQIYILGATTTAITINYYQ